MRVSKCASVYDATVTKYLVQMLPVQSTGQRNLGVKYKPLLVSPTMITDPVLEKLGSQQEPKARMSPQYPPLSELLQEFKLSPV